MIDLKSHIRTVSGFPIPSIEFRDITSLLEDPSAFADVMMSLSSCINPWSPTRLVGIESRGFIFGAPLAWDCNIPFILARKPGKLPNYTFKKEDIALSSFVTRGCDTNTRALRVYLFYS